ncbi:hypothetical protein LINGRAHAP2_LOCUS5819 [Linum grandiflorum]
MKSPSGLVIGLSLVFGCLFLALAAELYYLLWWKKRITHRESETEEESHITGSFTANHHPKEFLHFVCWKKPAAQPDPTQTDDPDLESGCQGKDKDSLLVKGGGFGGGEAEESVELELMRLHNLAGPPRFLFTIKEEEKEDLESECDKRSRKGSRTRSLSDILMAVDNNTSTAPLFTPLASPRCSNPLDSYNRQGFNFNPLFESSSMEVRSSPPPKFKFLRDAEEKLLKRLLAESAGGGEGKPLYPAMAAEVREGSFLGFLYAKNTAGVHRLPQVIPLASSPSATT